MRSPRRWASRWSSIPRRGAILERYYETRGGVTEARLRMARVPDGADLIANRMSGAPGIRIGNIFIMAGVPHITAGMLDALTGDAGGRRAAARATIGCWVAESEVADLLRTTEKAHEGCQIGSYPFFREGRVGANFVVRSTDQARAGHVHRRADRWARGDGYARRWRRNLIDRLHPAGGGAAA